MTEDKSLYEKGMLRTVTVVKVEHEDKFLTRVWVESNLGDKFMWSMPYNLDWTKGRVLDMIVDVMDEKTRLDKQREIS